MKVNVKNNNKKEQKEITKIYKNTFGNEATKKILKISRILSVIMFFIASIALIYILTQLWGNVFIIMFIPLYISVESALIRDYLLLLSGESKIHKILTKIYNYGGRLFLIALVGVVIYVIINKG